MINHLYIKSLLILVPNLNVFFSKGSRKNEERRLGFKIFCGWSYRNENNIQTAVVKKSDLLYFKLHMEMCAWSPMYYLNVCPEDKKNVLLSEFHRKLSSSLNFGISSNYY